jgi:hypothetical protein
VSKSVFSNDFISICVGFGGKMAARQGYARSVSKIVIFTDLRFPNSAFSPQLRSVRRPGNPQQKKETVSKR